MSMQDPISDMLTRIKNAQMANYNSLSMPNSKIKTEIARVLKEQGFITDYSVVNSAKNEKFFSLNIKLKYHHGKPVIDLIKRISRPGLRVYKNYNDLPTVMGGLGVAIVSTSKGIMTAGHAKQKQLGGEVLCHVA